MRRVTPNDPRFSVGLKLLELHPPVEQGGRYRPGELVSFVGRLAPAGEEWKGKVAPPALIVPQSLVGLGGEWVSSEDLARRLGLFKRGLPDVLRVYQYVQVGVLECYAALPELRRFYVVVDSDRLFAMNTLHAITGRIPKAEEKEVSHAERRRA